jgi:hypothetical protein
MMNTIKYIVLIATLFLYNCSSNDDTNSPKNITSTIKTFGGTKNESAQAVTKTTDGGFAVLGYTQSIDGDITDKLVEGFDYWILKFNANQELQWSKTYGGSGDDRGHDIIQTIDGGFAIIGSSQSSDEDVTINAGSQDYWIAKLDASGTLIWQKSFGYSGLDNGISVIQSTDGGFLLIGVLDVTASGGEGNSRSTQRHAGGDYWTIKLDANGEKQWSKFYGGSFTDTPYDCIQTEDNGFIIVGSSDSNDVDISGNKGGYDFWLIKISNTGTLLWEKSFGGTEIDEARAITTSGDGNYIIVGDTRSNDIDISKNNGAADLWVIKISPLGDLIWEKTFGGSNFDVGRSIKKTRDNGFLISGSSRSANGDLTANQGQNDAWVLEVDNNGILQWQKTLGGSDIDFAYDALQLNDGKFVVVGESNSADHDITENKGFSDLLLIQLDNE